MPAATATMLTSQQTSLIQGAASINVASSNLQNLPTVARAYGCVVSDNGEIRVFVEPAQAGQLLENISVGRSIAVVFNRPSTHEAIQLKTTRANIDTLTDTDLKVMSRYREGLISELLTMGFPQRFTQALIPSFNTSVIAIKFIPEQIFEQSPGPKAGEKLSP